MFVLQLKAASKKHGRFLTFCSLKLKAVKAKAAAIASSGPERIKRGEGF
jgi:hypothetical protein